MDAGLKSGLEVRSVMGLRVGLGYDVHPFAEGRKLILGGVELPADRGLQGHSDGDPVSHAIADALLGALALGDLGRHFPDSDPRWRGADSLDLLERVTAMLAERGASPVNVDVTVVCDAPTLAPHISAMREKLSRALGVALERVSIKATRTEGVGVGAGADGVAAHAVALIEITE